MYIDYDALVISQKVLVIISIVLICLTNVILIVKQVRKRLFHHSPKLMTVIALAIGDVFHALFPLVIEARSFFDPSYHYLTCSTTLSYVTYQTFLLHFVYGLGLIVLMALAACRRRLPLNVTATLRAVLVSSSPWFLGLIVVLPLCMSRVDHYNGCVNRQPIEAMYAVSVFVPASLALLVAIAVNCLKISGDQQGQGHPIGQQQVIYDNQSITWRTGNSYAPAPSLSQSPPNQQSVVHPPIFQSGTSYYRTLLNSDQPYGGYQQLTPYNNDPANGPGFSQHPNQPGVYYSSTTNQYSPCQYSISQPFTNQHSTNQYNISQYSISHQGVSQVNAPANQASTQNTRAELKKLAIITGLFFIMVVPQPSLVLAIDDKTWYDQYAVTVISQIFFWLMVARSYLTPVLMMSYADL